MSKVFVLSLPKSGTYMWSNLLKQLGYKFSNKHIAYNFYQNIPHDREEFFNEPQRFFVKSSLSESLKHINDGEFAVGHLPCTPEIIDLLEDFKLIFSYRNLTDSLVSFINYTGNFKINKEKLWTDESLPNTQRIEMYLRSDVIDFIRIANSVSGWKNLKSKDYFLEAEYKQVVNFDSQVLERAAEFFGISTAQMCEKLQAAIAAPSFTKIENKLKNEDCQGDVFENFYTYYGLDNINQRFGFGQHEVITKQDRVKKVAIICNPQFIHYNYVHNYLSAFDEYKGDYVVDFIPVPMMQDSSVLYDFSNYSLVVVTFHIRPWLSRWGNVEFETALFRYQGTKTLLLHDEYDETNALKQWIRDFGINHVFSVIPESYLSKVYSAGEFPDCKFYSVLAAYVSSSIPTESVIPPINLRTMDIVYRGRVAQPWRGELVNEKYKIGEYFKSLNKYGLCMDLESHEDERIHGDAWQQFLMSSRATLGTESGSNVFDVDGRIRRWFESNSCTENDSVEDLPGELNFREMNLGVKMNQISPKIFEAISCKTALILYEGEYSGVILPGHHYIELKKDHSNIDDVITKLTDSDYLQGMVDNAYEDIIKSGLYTYKSIMSNIFNANSEPVFQTENTMGVFQHGLSFNNLVNTQLADKIALLKASNSRVRHISQDRTMDKARIKKYRSRVENMGLAIKRLKLRIDKLKMNNNRLQAKIKTLENFKQETENSYLWKLNNKIHKITKKTK